MQFKLLKISAFIFTLLAITACNDKKNKEQHETSIKVMSAEDNTIPPHLYTLPFPGDKPRG